MSERDDHLWDPDVHPADPEVAELERLLGRFAHDDRPLAEPTPVRRGPSPWWWVAAAAAVVLATTLWFVLEDGEPKPKDASIALLADGRVLAESSWVVVDTKRPQVLTLGRRAADDVGRLELTAGSRLQIQRIGDDRTQLYLERGQLHAFVTPEAAPRFFQVGTPSGTCVDLGCEYDLVVDDAGEAHVRVTLGQIAFEFDRGDVYVPRGAECRVSTDGAGLPHFTDCDSMIRQVAEKYRGARNATDILGIAEFLCQIIDRKKDSLTLWHLLRLDIPEVREVVERKLLVLVGHPDVRGKDPDAIKGAAPLSDEEWRRHLESYWW
ncbi:MAG: FecR domain-containing protein [Planctomycetes bacterium]|nr:FecR domain-containing protein [Planctomycetota bacterium]